MGRRQAHRALALPQHPAYDLARANHWQAARQAQQYPLIQATKQILAWSDIDCGECLAPRRALTAGEAESLRAALTQSNFEQEIFAN